MATGAAHTGQVREITVPAEEGQLGRVRAPDFLTHTDLVSTLINRLLTSNHSGTRCQPLARPGRSSNPSIATSPPAWSSMPLPRDHRQHQQRDEDHNVKQQGRELG